jgi:hypothetical protein
MIRLVISSAPSIASELEIPVEGHDRVRGEAIRKQVLNVMLWLYRHISTTSNRYSRSGTGENAKTE